MILLAECVTACILFTLVVVAVSLKDPLAQVNNWPPAIQQRAQELGLIRKEQMSGSKKVYAKKLAAALVIDCLWVCHDRRVRIPGTENMKEYKDYWFHIRGSFMGQALGMPVALLVGGLTALIGLLM